MKRNDVTAGADLFENLLQSAPRSLRDTEMPATESTQVEGVHVLVREGVRDVFPSMICWASPSTIAVLPTPGSPMSTGFVLRAAGEDLHNALDLALPTDHRVELVIARQLSEIASETDRERWSRWTGASVRPLEPPRMRAQAPPHPGRRTANWITVWRTLWSSAPSFWRTWAANALALADEAEEDVLGPDVVVAELKRFSQRQLQHLFWREG